MLSKVKTIAATRLWFITWLFDIVTAQPNLNMNWELLDNWKELTTPTKIWTIFLFFKISSRYDQLNKHKFDPSPSQLPLGGQHKFSKIFSRSEVRWTQHLQPGLIFFGGGPVIELLRITLLKWGPVLPNWKFLNLMLCEKSINKIRSDKFLEKIKG